MKKSLALLLTIVLSFFGCNRSTKNMENTTDRPIGAKRQPIDTTYFFIRRILNASPREVALKLGNPDQQLAISRDCVIENPAGTCVQGTYQHEKYFVEYSRNKLKWIEIERFKPFDEDVIQRLGFQNLTPTFSGKQVISWRGQKFKGNASNGPLLSIPGIIEISVSKSS
ncbi:MAG TPA: hypothetical protein VL728_06830, partial [Cyclobacteriaceae bacterium]|nr:hypothetical protein [Cyclobacteriaceae bacterium]